MVAQEHDVAIGPEGSANSVVNATLHTPVPLDLILRQLLLLPRELARLIVGIGLGKVSVPWAQLATFRTQARLAVVVNFEVVNESGQSVVISREASVTAANRVALRTSKTSPPAQQMKHRPRNHNPVPQS